MNETVTGQIGKECINEGIACDLDFRHPMC